MKPKRVIKDAVWGWRYENDPWQPQPLLTWREVAYWTIGIVASIAAGLGLRWLIIHW